MPGILLLPSAGGSRSGGRIPHTRHGWCSACDLYWPLTPPAVCSVCGTRMIMLAGVASCPACRWVAPPVLACGQCAAPWATVFASGVEAAEHATLRRLERAGEIWGLVCHPRYQIPLPDGTTVQFTPDFQYTRADGRTVICEVKSPQTAKLADYRLRVKLFRAAYPTLVWEEVIR